jgi:Leucine-rich repeat (LRR) protein
MQLIDLSVDDSRVSDLAPLEGMPLRSLNCSATTVADLAPLKGMHLAYLSCSETQVSDLTPLGGMHLTGVTISVANITKGIDVLRAMKTLRRIGDGNPRLFSQLGANEFWKKYDAGGFASRKPAPAAGIAAPAK